MLFKQGRRRHGGSGGSCPRCLDGAGATRGQEVPFSKNLSHIHLNFYLFSPQPLSKDGFLGSFKNKKKELMSIRQVGRIRIFPRNA